MPEISFTLNPSPPFSLEFTAWALRQRLKNEVDRWNGKNYSRIFVCGDKAVKVSVSQEGGLNKPKLHVVVVGVTDDLQTVRIRIFAMLEKMFPIRKDLTEFYSLSGGDRRLRLLAERFTD
jgi:hypothetical protein